MADKDCGSITQYSRTENEFTLKSAQNHFGFWKLDSLFYLHICLHFWMLSIVVPVFFKNKVNQN